MPTEGGVLVGVAFVELTLLTLPMAALVAALGPAGVVALPGALVVLLVGVLLVAPEAGVLGVVVRLRRKIFPIRGIVYSLLLDIYNDYRRLGKKVALAPKNACWRRSWLQRAGNQAKAV
tara:strand:+ start:161 stop:517 length:357 start_codon:yes stop_codon:yes gene_type:complete